MACDKIVIFMALSVNKFWSRQDKEDREGIPHTHPIP